MWTVLRAHWRSSHTTLEKKLSHHSWVNDYAIHSYIGQHIFSKKMWTWFQHPLDGRRACSLLRKDAKRQFAFSQELGRPHITQWNLDSCEIQIRETESSPIKKTSNWSRWQGTVSKADVQEGTTRGREHRPSICCPRRHFAIHSRLQVSCSLDPAIHHARAPRLFFFLNEYCTSWRKNGFGSDGVELPNRLVAPRTATPFTGHGRYSLYFPNKSPKIRSEMQAIALAFRSEYFAAVIRLQVGRVGKSSSWDASHALCPCGVPVYVAWDSMLYADGQENQFNTELKMSSDNTQNDRQGPI